MPTNDSGSPKNINRKSRGLLHYFAVGIEVTTMQLKLLHRSSSAHILRLPFGLAVAVAIVKLVESKFQASHLTDLQLRLRLRILSKLRQFCCGRCHVWSCKNTQDAEDLSSPAKT